MGCPVCAWSVTPDDATPVTPSLSSSEPSSPSGSASSSSSSSPLYWTSRAKQLSSLRPPDRDGAIAAWSRAISLDPTAYKYYTNRSNLLLLSARTREAEEDARRSLQLRRDGNAGACYALGRALVKQERWQEARTEFEKAIAEGAKGEMLTQAERQIRDLHKRTQQTQTQSSSAAAAATVSISAFSASSSVSTVILLVLVLSRLVVVVVVVLCSSRLRAQPPSSGHRAGLDWS